MKASVAVIALAMLATLGVFSVSGHSLVQRMYEGKFLSFFIVPPHIKAEHSADELYRWMRKALMLAVAGTVFLGAVMWIVNARKRNVLSRDGIVSFFWLGLCSSICAMVLAWQGYNSTWYPIEKAMSFTADPPYVHRVLFVLVARAFQVLHPTLSDLNAFLLSQCVAIVLAMIAIRKWAELFIRKDLAFFSQVLLTAILVPTLRYFTFYDIGIIFFYSLGLTLLFKRQTTAYVAMVGLATLNHELILFLIFTSAFLYFEGRPTRKWIAFVAAQLIVYAAIRTTLFQLMPVSRAWAQGNVWVNIEYILVKRRDLADTAALMLWFAVAGFCALRPVHPGLKKCTILFPMLLGMTLLVGQLNEARQFDAFIPVAIALILTGVRAGSDEKVLPLPGRLRNEAVCLTQ